MTRSFNCIATLIKSPIFLCFKRYFFFSSHGVRCFCIVTKHVHRWRPNTKPYGMQHTRYTMFNVINAFYFLRLLRMEQTSLRKIRVYTSTERGLRVRSQRDLVGGGGQGLRERAGQKNPGTGNECSPFGDSSLSAEGKKGSFVVMNDTKIYYIIV